MANLPELARYNAGQTIGFAQAGQKQRTLADLGQYAAKGDYQGAAGAAFAGGQPDIGAAMAKMGTDQHQQIVQDAASLAFGADTPEKWAQAGQQFQQAHPGIDWAPFQARDQVIKSAQSVSDQMAEQHWKQSYALQQQQVGIAQDKANNEASMMSMFGFGGGQPTSAEAPPLPGGQPSPTQAAASRFADPSMFKNASFQQPADATQPAPSDGSGRDEQFLASLPAPMQGLVKGVADYRMDISKITSLRGNASARTALAMAVAKYDPSVDLNNYDTHRRMKVAYTSGSQGQALGSINAALEHMDDLNTKFDQIGNGAFVPGNAARNWVDSVFSKGKATQTTTQAMGVATEIAKALRGTGTMAEGEAKDWLAQFNRDMSPEQFHNAVNTAVDLLSKRSLNLNESYASTMGQNVPMFLSGTALKSLKNLGRDVTDFIPGGIGGEPYAPSGQAPPQQGGQQTNDGYTIEEIQ